MKFSKHLETKHTLNNWWFKEEEIKNVLNSKEIKIHPMKI